MEAIRTNKTDSKKEQMLEALERSLGIVTTACNACGINRSTHYDWMRKDPEYKQAVKDIDNRTLDFAESHLQRGQPSRYHLFPQDEGQGTRVCGTPRD